MLELDKALNLCARRQLLGDSQQGQSTAELLGKCAGMLCGTQSMLGAIDAAQNIQEHDTPRRIVIYPQ